MPWFPMFVDLTGRPCLIVGGGTVAARKAEKLRPYAPSLTVIAPEFVPGFENCTLLPRPYRPGDEDGMSLVIAATGDPILNHAISTTCRAKNIPVNVVDDKEYCSFLFPCVPAAAGKRGEALSLLQRKALRPLPLPSGAIRPAV